MFSELLIKIIYARKSCTLSHGWGCSYNYKYNKLHQKFYQVATHFLMLKSLPRFSYMGIFLPTSIPQCEHWNRYFKGIGVWKLVCGNCCTDTRFVFWKQITGSHGSCVCTFIYITSSITMTLIKCCWTTDSSMARSKLSAKLLFLFTARYNCECTMATFGEQGTSVQSQAWCLCKECNLEKFSIMPRGAILHASFSKETANTSFWNS